MVTENTMQEHAKPRRSHRADYIAAIIVNVVALIVVNQILNWGFLHFLTHDFTQVIPIQNISIAMTIIFNAAFLFYDPDWFTSLLKVVLNGVGIAVLLRYLSVFPFNFAGSSFDWALVFRIMIIIGIVGCALALIVEVFKFGGAMMRRR